MSRQPTLNDYHRKIAGSDNDPCVLCGAVATTLDHIHPLSRGGSRSSMMNIAPMCKGCNNNKGNSPMLIALLTSTQLKSRIRQNHTVFVRKTLKAARQARIEREWLSKQAGENPQTHHNEP